MIKEHKSVLTKIEIIVDFLILVSASFVTNFFILWFDGIRNFSTYSIIPNINTESYYYLIVLIFSFLTLIFYFFDNAYLYYRFKSKKKLIKQITGGIFKSSIVMFILLIIFDNKEFPIKYFFKYVMVSVTIFIIYRFLVLKIFVILRERGYNIKHIVLLYTNEKNENNFFRLMEKHKDWGLNVIDKININNEDSFEKFFRLLKSYAVDDIYIFPENNSILPGDGFFNYINLSHEFGKNIRFFFESNTIYTKAKPIVSFVDKYPTLLFSQKQILESYAAVKRFVDIIFGLIGSLITISFIPVVGVIIKLTSKGPILFKQLRVGSNGRNFYIYKFRTMYNDAEEKKKDLEQHNELSGAVFKMKNDPRVTKIGKFLRATSLDEFPQFFNVLNGDMSLIGTRPPTPNEVKDYENWQHKRISIKPGITGLWQVSGRNKITDFDEIAKLDIEYIDNWSIWLDVKIFFKTFFALFKGQ